MMDKQNQLLAGLYKAQGISPERYDALLQQNQRSLSALMAVLQDEPGLSSQVLGACFVASYGLPWVDVGQAQIAGGVIRHVTAGRLLAWQAIPFYDEQGQLALACGRLPGKEEEATLARLLGEVPIFYYAQGQAVEEALLATVSGLAEGEQRDELPSGVVYDLSAHDLGEQSSAQIVLHHLLRRGIVERASDIHLDPQEDEMWVRLRVDGALFDLWRLPKGLYQLLINYIKIRSDMDIAEKRLPQDGHFKIRYEERLIDVRTATLPLFYGEKIVLRILDQKALFSHLQALAMAFAGQEVLAQMLAKPHGLILLCGPTGSGKSTTLYSFMQNMKNKGRSIFSLEAPVEYTIAGINQVQINEKAGLDFVTALRGMLRVDPDIIVIGEIRDEETARIAVRAANTGHLVFATLHTNDAISAVARLRDMGIARYLVAETLLGVIAQRLVRRTCACSTAGSLIGCERCRYTGYYGRIALQEHLLIDDLLRQRIFAGEALGGASLPAGFVSLREDGLAKVTQGLTTKAELMAKGLLA